MHKSGELEFNVPFQHKHGYIRDEHKSGDVMNFTTVACRISSRLNDITRMWVNAQPDGRPAEHRWRPLFNAAKFS